MEFLLQNIQISTNVLSIILILVFGALILLSIKNRPLDHEIPFHNAIETQLLDDMDTSPASTYEEKIVLKLILALQGLKCHCMHPNAFSEGLEEFKEIVVQESRNCYKAAPAVEDTYYYTIAYQHSNDKEYILDALIEHIEWIEQKLTTNEFEIEVTAEGRFIINNFKKSSFLKEVIIKQLSDSGEYYVLSLNM